MSNSSTSACVKSTAGVSDDDAVTKPKRFSRKPSPLAKYIAKAGDVNAGVLLHQIEYRFKTGDTLWKAEGDLWVAQTRECWCDETGLTLKQYKRAKDILIERKLIKVTHNKLRSHHRWQTTFIRLQEPVGQTIYTVPTGPTLSGPGKAHCTVVPLGTDKEGEDKEGENHKGSFADKPQKTKNKKLNKKQGKDKGKGGGKGKGVTCKDIEKVWLAAHATAFPEKSMTPFAGPDWNYAKILIKKLGNDAPAVIDANVKEWEWFLMRLKSEKGLFSQGHSPCMKKLAHYADVALNLWKEGITSEEDQVLPADGNVIFGK